VLTTNDVPQGTFEIICNFQKIKISRDIFSQSLRVGLVAEVELLGRADLRQGHRP